jgi:hypothetical protein
MTNSKEDYRGSPERNVNSNPRQTTKYLRRGEGAGAGGKIKLQDDLEVVKRPYTANPRVESRSVSREKTAPKRIG